MSLSLTLVAAWPAAAAPATRPVLRVAPDGWGDARAADVRKVVESAAAELFRHLPADRKVAPIDVSYDAQGPIVLHRRGPGGEHLVRLNVRGRYWAQLAFQFSHELGHILCDYRPGPADNKWLEESICELASLHALRAMSRAWAEAPPYPNWKDFAPHLADYAAQRMEAARLAEGRTLADWYRDHAEELRKDSTCRELNQVVATALLPLFEASPESWDAVRFLNAAPPARRSFRQHLAEWRRHAPERHRPFIDRVAREFGIILG